MQASSRTDPKPVTPGVSHACVTEGQKGGNMGGALEEVEPVCIPFSWKVSVSPLDGIRMAVW